MEETLDFTGKILIDENQGTNIILNAYKALSWYDYEELTFLTCYRPVTETYIIFLDIKKHRIKSAKDYLTERDYNKISCLLVRERGTLLEGARKRAVTDIKDRWGNYFKSIICKDKRHLKYPTLEWANKGLRELEECPEKYIVWELE